MTPAARAAAAATVLEAVLAGAPAERELTGWARASRFAGSGDRAAVRDIVFDCLRNLRSFQARAGGQGARALVLGWLLARDQAPETFFNEDRFALAPLTGAEREALVAARTDRNGLDDRDDRGAEAADMQDWVWSRLCRDLGAEPAARICQTLKSRAPLDLRVNLARGSVDALRGSLEREGIGAVPVAGVAGALRVERNPRRVNRSDAYLSGMVEIQDAASQCLTLDLPLEPGWRVLDLCAGGGGKTLAMAARVPGADYAAWDISPDRLAPLRERAERAGARVTLLSDRPAGVLHDLVFVDAPCSGSGAWRRSPEAKWRLSQERLDDLLALQRSVLEHGLSVTAPGGLLVYATCSVFDAENAAQLTDFLDRHPGCRLEQDRAWLPGDPGDGFYRAVIRKP